MIDLGLDACFAELRPGNLLPVWRLDRLRRSVRHLVTLIDELRDRNLGFRSVRDGAIDTTTPSGEPTFHVFSALAQFERRLIQKRTKSRSRRRSCAGPYEWSTAAKSGRPQGGACQQAVCGHVGESRRHLCDTKDFNAALHLSRRCRFDACCGLAHHGVEVCEFCFLTQKQRHKADNSQERQIHTH